MINLPPRQTLRITGVFIAMVGAATSSCIDVDRTGGGSGDIAVDAVVSDGNSCTVDEDCIGKLAPTSCTRVDCQSGSCALATDVSKVGLECTETSLCEVGTCTEAGECAGVMPRDCSDLDEDVCATGRCDETDGTCTVDVAEAGVACSAPLCYAATCDGEGQCVDQGVTEGAPCSSGNPCLEGGTCSATGVCIETGSCPCETSTDCDDGLDCTKDSCEDGECLFVPYAAACAINGECSWPGELAPNNACLSCAPALSTTSWSPVDCDDGQACTVDECTPTGGCSNTPSPDDTPCQAGLTCGANASVCIAGQCECDVQCVLSSDCATNPEAPPLLPCQKHKCDEGLCQAIGDEAAEGTPCDVGDPCYQGGLCQQGVCDAPPVDCSGGACQTGSCVALGDGYQCIWENLTVGTSCDDGSACTSEDACDVDGICQGTPKDCSAFDTICAAGACIGGVCDLSPAENGTTCDDGNECTNPDTCLDGVCVGASACTCESSADCDDGLACTNDICNGGQCEFVPVAGTCVIDNSCLTEGETKTDNPCMLCDPPRSALSWSIAICDDGQSCTDDSCDLGSGDCAFAPNDANSCNDGDDCTADDHCAGGLCVGTCECTLDTDCAANPPPQCQRWTCTSFNCVAVPDAVLNGADCDDGLFCTTGDVCSAGVCGGEPTDCGPVSGLCTLGVCDEDADACVAVDAASGTSCDDADPCTEGDLCDASGNCQGVAKDCSELDTDCMLGVCNAGNCQGSVQEGISCEDDDVCTEMEQCNSAGECVWTWNSSAEECGCQSDGDCDNLSDGCNTGVCDVTLQECKKVPLTGSLPCDDADPCTQDDACQGGACVGEPYSCDDGQPCTTDQCDGDGSCSAELLNGFCLIDGTCRSDSEPDPNNPCQACLTTQSTSAWSAADGGACDDGDDCTNADSCSAGSCSGTTYSCPDDGLTCTSEQCTDAPDGCESVITAGFCVIDGTCYQVGSPDPSNVCQACQPGTSQTSWTNIGGDCDDGQPCTHSDSCSNGVCAGSAYLCNDNKTCTSDACDGLGGCDFTINSGHCLINDACRSPGALNPSNECQKCDGALSSTAWSGVDAGDTCDDGLACTSPDTCDGLGTCVGGSTNCSPRWCEDAQCTGSGCNITLKPGHCLIDNECVLSGGVNPDNPCQECVDTVSTSSWTDVTKPCDDGDSCTFNDTCSGGSCIGNPYSCDDGHDCTVDSCDSQGGCDNAVKSDSCLIGETCLADGATHPENDCQACTTSTSQTSWTNAAEGSSCAGSGASCTQSICQSGACTPEYDPGSGACYIGGKCIPQLELNGENECEQCDIDNNPQAWSPVSDGTECGSTSTWSQCGGDFCEAGECLTTTSADFAPCDDGDASTTGDWCWKGLCDGFEQSSTDTHNHPELPDRYERAHRIHGAEAYATYTVPNAPCGGTGSEMGTMCFGDVHAGHFVAATAEEWSGPMYTQTLLPLGRHGVTEAFAAVAEQPVEYTTTWQDWTPYTGDDITDTYHGWLNAPDIGGTAEQWLFVDAGMIWSCADGGFGIACTPSSIAIGAPAGFVSHGDEPFLIDTYLGNIRTLSRSQAGWDVSWTNALAGAGPASDATSTEETAVAVGKKGMLYAGWAFPGELVKINVPELQTQAQIEFTSVTTFNDHFFAVGNQVGTDGADNKTMTIIMVFAPTDGSVTDASNWRYRVLDSVTGSCGTPCWVNDNRATGMVGLDINKMLYVFGGVREGGQTNTQERNVWMFAGND